MRQTSLNMVYELAKTNDKVVFVGSDLGPGVLDDFKKNIPDRFFMEGIAEQFIIGFSAGLAKEGFIPYVNTIATFITRRCFEQLTIDLSLHNLPVRLIGNGGGLVYAPLGPTHQAIDDIAILKAIPNMTIVSPCDSNEMRMLMTESITWPHPMYIRLGRGGEEVVTPNEYEFKIGKSTILKKLTDIVFITTGTMAQKALLASNILKEESGIDVGVMHMHTIHPFDKDSLMSLFPNIKLIVTVEEHILVGGLGSTVIEFLSDNNSLFNVKVKRVGLENQFVQKYGTQDELQEYFGLSTENLVNIVMNNYKE